VHLLYNVCRQVSNTLDRIDVNLAGTKIRNRRLSRRLALDNPGDLDDNSINESGLKGQ